LLLSIKLPAIVRTWTFSLVMKDMPPPFPFEEVLLVMDVYEIVILPFEFTIPIAPP